MSKEGLPTWSINYFIRKAVRGNQPVFESYQELCALHPDRDIDYGDFDWKYYQYHHGCSDLNLERSLENKSPVTFSDLPMVVLENVVLQSSLRDCLTLRKVCHDLRNLVDSSQVCCASIEFQFYLRCWEVDFENLKLEYRENNDGGCEVIARRKDTNEFKVYEDTRHFKQVMLTDVSSFLDNPKLKIGCIRLDTWIDEADAEFFDLLSSLNFQLDIRTIECERMECIWSLLPFWKPDKLKEIIFDAKLFFNAEDFIELAELNLPILQHPKLTITEISLDSHTDESVAKFTEILELLDDRHSFRSIEIRDEAWIETARRMSESKKLKEMIFTFMNVSVPQFHQIVDIEQAVVKDWDLPEGVGIEEMLRFKCSEIYVDITDEVLIKIRDNLHHKSARLETCCLLEVFVAHRPIPTEEEKYEQLERIMSEHPAYDVSTRRFSIPNSQDYFQMKVERNSGEIILSITRTAKHRESEESDLQHCSYEDLNCNNLFIVYSN